MKQTDYRWAHAFKANLSRMGRRRHFIPVSEYFGTRPQSNELGRYESVRYYKSAPIEKRKGWASR